MTKLARPTDKVIIIGAGLSGLAAAWVLSERGIPVQVLDKASGPGDAWHHRHPQLRLNTHRHLSSLPGMAIPKSAGAFPSRDSIIRYLNDYAQKLETEKLPAPIIYGVSVNNIKSTSSGWLIETDRSDYRAQHVVVATGVDRIPRIPDWEGYDQFRGQLIHSADFGDLQHYRGKNVLVVGAGNSGSDVLNHLSTIDTGKLWVSVRHGSVVFPTRLLGVPVQRLSPIMSALPAKVVDKLLVLTEYLAFGKLAKYGLSKHPDGGATRLLREGVSPAIDNGFIRAVKTGAIKIVPTIKRFTADTVELSDGRMLQPDIVIAATGYRTGLQNLLGQVEVLNARGVPAFHGAEQHPKYPGLWFTGMRPQLTGMFHMAAMVAEEIAKAIKNSQQAQASTSADQAVDFVQQ